MGLIENRFERNILTTTYETSSVDAFATDAVPYDSGGFMTPRRDSDVGTHARSPDLGGEALVPEIDLALEVPRPLTLRAALHAITGLTAWLFLPLFLLYGVVPLLDWLLGEDATSPPAAAVPDLDADPYYRWLVYAGVALAWLTVVAGAWYATTAGLGVAGFFGMALGVGWTTGAAINMGHELGHKKGAGERLLARIALAPSGYGHFSIEHVRGHHRDVATPEEMDVAVSKNVDFRPPGA